MASALEQAISASGKTPAKGTIGRGKPAADGTVNAIVRGDLPEGAWLWEELTSMFKSWACTKWRTRTNEDNTTYTYMDVLFTFRSAELNETVQTKPNIRCKLNENGSVSAVAEKGEYNGREFKKRDLRNFFLSTEQHPERKAVSKQAFNLVEQLIAKGTIKAG